MKQQFDDAEATIETALEKVRNPMKARNANATGNPGDVIDATEAALVDLKSILVYFRTSFVDSNGEFLKISFWKWITEKQYREKIRDAVVFTINKIKVIASRY